MSWAIGERLTDASSSAVDERAELVYRPHLDGLRAVAVYLVVLFHAGSGWFSGGFVGVDVFFVLSGYLVTQLLLRDISANGAIRFARFYSRRFRRLLPAAFVALTVTAVVYTAIASPAEVLDAVGSFKAAFLYSTNWYFIHQAAGYFGADVSANPVVHFWSLAVEEQFYLLWPLALGGVYALTRRIHGPRQMRVIRIVVGLGAVASALFALSLRSSNPNRAYYGTDARAYELLAGAFVALTPALFAAARRFPRSLRAATLISAGALVIVATSWIDYNAIVRGVIVTIITCVVIVAVEAADGGFVKRMLSTPLMIYLGKISYGTYLWHWLVILVIARFFHLSTVSTIAVTAFLATAVASLSYQILERPIRTSTLLDHHRKLVITVGLAISVLSAVVLIPKLVDPTHATTPTLQTAPTNSNNALPTAADWRAARRDNHPGEFDCLHAPSELCTIVHGPGKHILLIGDSEAVMLVPTLTAIAKQEHLTLSVTARGACPWQRHLYVEPHIGDAIGQACKEVKEDLYNRLIPALRPDVIVAVNLGWGPIVFGPSSASLSELAAPDRKIVLVEPIPVSPFDPINCLSSAKALEQCAYVTNTNVLRVEQFYRRLAKQHPAEIFSVDLDHVVCPFLPICDAVVNGQIVKFDRWHLTAPFATAIAPQLDAYLKQIGVLRRH